MSFTTTATWVMVLEEMIGSRTVLVCGRKDTDTIPMINTSAKSMFFMAFIFKGYGK
jgi:hypothetical protein